MAKLSTLSASGMRGINRSAILDVIRRESPIPRAAIAEKLHVSLPTVMRIVDDLIAEGLVRTQEEKQWSGGRRRSLLEFNASGHAVLGVDLGGTKIYGAIADLSGQILQEVEAKRHHSLGDESFQVLVDVIEDLMASPQLADKRLHGIGVGVPGVTLHREGVVIWAPSLNWRDYPLRQMLSERFSVPIMVDNDLNLAAQGEHWFGAAQKSQTAALVSLGTGIGAGIIINGALFRGARQSAGEVGYMLPGREFLNTRYDSFGALETVASGAGITSRAREALKGRLNADELTELTAESVFEAGRRGETWAQTIVNDAFDYLAMMIVNISAVIDPEIIILSGGMANTQDIVMSLSKRLEGILPTPPDIVLSPLGYRATVLGAIVNVLQNTDDFYLIHKLS